MCQRCDLESPGEKARQEQVFAEIGGTLRSLIKAHRLSLLHGRADEQGDPWNDRMVLLGKNVGETVEKGPRRQWMIAVAVDLLMRIEDQHPGALDIGREPIAPLARIFDTPEGVSEVRDAIMDTAKTLYVCGHNPGVDVRGFAEHEAFEMLNTAFVEHAEKAKAHAAVEAGDHVEAAGVLARAVTGPLAESLLLLSERLSEHDRMNPTPADATPTAT